ncbi:hypothetical protein LOK49_LG08G01907 [Camellia lanceoleosa]|uniref:Uncharacterized protein n=1 Tax=Camellia lanceoleosa TaxID=1840588 RepID=A0ACC0GNG7_9ERIC|nr:hypothetical protein LOK49_LG08G01907 [Camellia lanceoleosa]
MVSFNSLTPQQLFGRLSCPSFVVRLKNSLGNFVSALLVWVVSSVVSLLSAGSPGDMAENMERPSGAVERTDSEHTSKSRDTSLDGGVLYW